MQKDGEIEALLKEHEELIGLHTHESKIKWNLISVYVALNVGLVSAVVVLIQNKTIEIIGAVSFLCLMGSLFSFATALMFKRNRYRISEWVREGTKVEKVLMEKALTLELFKICESFLEKQIKILYGMLILAILASSSNRNGISRNGLALSRVFPVKILQLIDLQNQKMIRNVEGSYE